MTSLTLAEAPHAASDIRLIALMEPLRRLEARAAEVAVDRAKAVTQLLEDLRWMDIPVRYAITVGLQFTDGAVVHVNEMHYKDEGPKPVADAHLADHCTGRWCRKVGELRWTRGKNAVGWKHLGTHRAITQNDRGLWICVPDGSEGHA